MKNIPIIHGFVTSILEIEFSSKFLALVKKAPYKANETKAAEPMANPLPIAAVVFPAESKASVLFLTTS